MALLKNRSFLVKMVKETPSGPVEEDVFDDIKNHFEKYKAAYIVGGVSLGIFGVAGITYLITRGVDPTQPISHGNAVTAERGIAVLGKKVVMSNVSYISANRQGPPSWVVRCKETGEIFSSQNAAASAMGLFASEVSQQLLGRKDNAQGFHFERICLAA
jgi:hypothetical protein